MLQVSLTARQLINALLQRDPAKRIGTTIGANEIKQHPFFRGLNWPLIRCMVFFFLGKKSKNELKGTLEDVQFRFEYLTYYVASMQNPPPLDMPIELIAKDPKAKEVTWEDDGVLVNALDVDIF